MFTDPVELEHSCDMHLPAAMGLTMATAQGGRRLAQCSCSTSPVGLSRLSGVSVSSSAYFSGRRRSRPSVPVRLPLESRRQRDMKRAGGSLQQRAYRQVPSVRLMPNERFPNGGCSAARTFPSGRTGGIPSSRSASTVGHGPCTRSSNLIVVVTRAHARQVEQSHVGVALTKKRGRALDRADPPDLRRGTNLRAIVLEWPTSDTPMAGPRAP
jgi:hypothetical protein